MLVLLFLTLSELLENLDLFALGQVKNKEKRPVLPVNLTWISWGSPLYNQTPFGVANEYASAGWLFWLPHYSEEAVKKHTGQTDPVEVMGALRSEKDSWKPPKL